MNFTSVWLIVFVGALCALPWLVKWIQRRTGLGLHGQPNAIKLIAALPLGPQQRVVTVEVGTGEARTQLVLGVTGQSVTCLHVLGKSSPAVTPVTPMTPMSAVSVIEPSASFGQKLQEHDRV